MFNHILVPLDGSQLAECVLPHLGALAWASNGRVTFLRVLERQEADQDRNIDPVDWHIRRKEVEAYIDHVASRFSDGSFAPQQAVLEGNAGDQIPEYARENGVDLILLSSHGRSGLTGWNVSGIVQKIILRSPTSTMIVRAHQPAQAGLKGLRYGKIMAPLDGSQRAECILPFVDALARQHGAGVIVAHVIRRPEMPRRSPPTQLDAELAGKLTERNIEEGEKYLLQIKARLPMSIDTRLIVSDSVSGPLHDLAEQEQVELVVMSAHGYSGETKWPYGSTVISFVAFGTTPLLIFQDLPGGTEPGRTGSDKDGTQERGTHRITPP